MPRYSSITFLSQPALPVDSLIKVGSHGMRSHRRPTTLCTPGELREQSAEVRRRSRQVIDGAKGAVTRANAAVARSQVIRLRLGAADRQSKGDGEK